MSKTKDSCRICLKVKPDLCSIYINKKNEYLPNVIYNISGVLIVRRTEPEAQICARCATAALVAQTIILRCQESEQRLQAQQMLDTDIRKQDVEEQADYEQHEQLEMLEDDYENYEMLQIEMPASEMLQIEMPPSEMSSQDDNSTAELDVNCVLAQQPVRTIAQQRRSTQKQTTFNCDHCDYSTRTGRRLIEHKRDAHKIYDPNIYLCSLCSQRFSWKPTLYRHIQLDHKTLPADKKYLCNECGCAYTREVHLIEHTKQRHGPRRYKCPDPECQQSFTRTFTLRRHYLSSHADSRGENFDKIGSKRVPSKRRFKEHL